MTNDLHFPTFRLKWYSPPSRYKLTNHLNARGAPNPPCAAGHVDTGGAGMAKLVKWLRASLLLAPLAAAGCFPPAIMLGVMAPTQPWVTERLEDRYQYKNDHRTPIMPPIRDGFPAPICEDPPSEQEVLRAMPRVTRGVPFFFEEFRDDIQIVSERLVDKIDP